MQWKDGDIDGVVIRRITRHDDSRGWLAELFRQDEILAGFMPVMGYVSVTKPGVTRGPHEHREQTDCFAFVGPGTFMLRLWDSRPGSPSNGRRMTRILGIHEPHVVIVPPGVVHAYTNICFIDAWVLNFPDALFRGAGRMEPADEIRHEDMPGSPYSMETEDEGGPPCVTER